MRDTNDGQEAVRSALNAWTLHSGTSGFGSESAPLGPVFSSVHSRMSLSADEAREEHSATIATVRWLAVAHVMAGLCGALIGVAVFIAASQTATPLVGVVAGIGVALIGAVAFLLAGTPRQDIQRFVRLLLPMVDVIVCVAVLAQMGPSALSLMLFLTPACVATVALSWRSGAAVTALDIALFIVVNVLRGPVMDSWVPYALLLAGVSSLLAFAYGVFAAQMTLGLETLQRQSDRLRAQRDQQHAEQQRLLDGLNLMEETQARLEQERALVNAQLAELTTVAYRMAEGDASAARVLRPGMSGSLDVLSGALLRLSQQLSGTLAAQQQKRQLDMLTAALRDQTAMLVAAETTLRDLNASAHTLVGEVQRVERGSGELPGLHPHALFQALRGVEQRAIEQAANTGVLSSRMAQLRGRQAELEAEARRASQALAESGVGGAFSGSYPGVSMGGFGSSGLYGREAVSVPATPSWPHFTPGR